ncbi:MAG TPA: tRNA lysidine(34) synthetase TilS [Candidatus Saccharimonadales bacterium]
MDVVLPKPGGYVVAVSGGVDSMALLHMLQAKSRQEDGWKLVVAHLDHGIRPDSADDRRLVQATARDYRLPFVYHEGRLGAGAGEAEARTARYDFLGGVRQASGARAIVTAHHQDDLLETAIINILRGSGRKGLTALSDRPDMARPLLKVPKSELVAYARDQGLRWLEDSTNQDETYLRNYVRRRLLPRFKAADRARLRQIINDLSRTNHELDTLLVNQLHMQTMAGRLDRQWFSHLPHAVAREVMAAWLRAHAAAGFDSKTLERLVVYAKTAAAGKTFPVQAGFNMLVLPDHLALASLER